MDGTMTDFKKRYFDNLDKTLQRIEDKVEKNTNLTEKVHNQAKVTNSRVTNLEDAVYNKKPASKLPAIWKDTRVIQIVFYISLAFVLLVAAATRFEISRLL